VQESWDIYNRPMFYSEMKKAGYIYASVSESHYLIGNAGLITFSKFPIKTERFKHFTRLSSAFVELFTFKGVLETVIETPRGDMLVFNVHLHMPSWFLGRAVRLFQLRRAVKLLNEHKNMPAVLAGDFNEHALWNDKSFVYLLTETGFNEPLPVSDTVPLTYRKENPLVDVWINRSHADKRFDYIFVRNLDLLGYKVKDYAPVYLNPDLSDHDPVLLSLVPNK
jgi:endonuclease/exonuclease/phosphatase family metal-dependent hydrolase